MDEPDPHLEDLLTYLKDTRGFDFTGYKRASLARRISRRTEAIGIPTYLDYLDHLQVHPEEFTALFNTVLINVTEFFRDPESWERLRGEMIPALVAARAPASPIRIWSAGCASGEEAYSLAIALCEHLGVDEFRERVKIYATDVDEHALAQARHATYPASAVANVPPDLLERYFEPQDASYAFRKDLRRRVILGRNDLVQDAPISRIDLLVCRNVLMYFNAETQGRILRRFHFALAPDGLLFLGKAEMLLGHTNLFVPTDGRRRFFVKAPGSHQAGPPFPSAPPDGVLPLSPEDSLREEAVLAVPMPQVVVTSAGRVALVSRQAELLFGLSARDLGRPLRDLEMSYRPLELRPYLEQAETDRRTVRIKDVHWLRGTDALHLEIQVTPLVGRSGEVLGTSIVYHDVSEAQRLRNELEATNRQLETAYEELQSTNEELETTNEELQSTNEELETMNEELQSTNDELQAMNEELRDRTDELHDLNGFLDSVLTGLRSAVVVLDPALRILVWNHSAEDLWGLRTNEARGQHFLGLPIGFPVDALAAPLRDLVGGGSRTVDVTVPAVNRFGRPVTVHVTGNVLHRTGDAVTGIILVMDAVVSEATTTT